MILPPAFYGRPPRPRRCLCGHPACRWADPAAERPTTSDLVSAAVGLLAVVALVAFVALYVAGLQVSP